MSGQITLGGHTYNNVSGEKFEEIKTILNRVEETKKREVRGGDVGIDEDGETTVCIGSGGDRKTWWLDKTQYLNKIPITLFNLADLVAEMKVKDGKTLQYGDSRDRTAFNRNIEAEIMLLGNIKIATRRGVDWENIVLSPADAFRFAAQLLMLSKSDV